MNKKSYRRHFLKQTALLGGSLLMLKAHPSRAEEPKPNRPKEAANRLANDTLKTIQNLRTTHGNFQDKPIPDAEIQTILQSGIRAANSSNMQTYSIVVVKSRKVMRDVCGTTAPQPE